MSGINDELTFFSQKERLYLENIYKRIAANHTIFKNIKRLITLLNYKKAIMKNKLLLLFTAILISGMTYGQFSFGVSPGLNLNKAHFGYKIGDKVVPYFGLQHMNVNVNYEDSGERYDYDTNQIENFSYSTDFKGRLIMPNIGVKFFIAENNKLKAFLNANFAKAFFSGKIEDDGVEEEELQEYVDAINIWGGEAGFGIEYFFDDNFSIGGEFGIRHLNFKYDHSYERTIFNPNTGNYDYEAERTEVIKVGSNPTYSRVSLNFYF